MAVSALAFGRYVERSMDVPAQNSVARFLVGARVEQGGGMRRIGKGGGVVAEAENGAVAARPLEGEVRPEETLPVCVDQGRGEIVGAFRKVQKGSGGDVVGDGALDGCGVIFAIVRRDVVRRFRDIDDGAFREGAVRRVRSSGRSRCGGADGKHGNEEGRKYGFHSGRLPELSHSVLADGGGRAEALQRAEKAAGTGNLFRVRHGRASGWEAHQGVPTRASAGWRVSGRRARNARPASRNWPTNGRVCALP